MFTIRSKELVHREEEEDSASTVNCWQIEVSEKKEEVWLEVPPVQLRTWSGIERETGDHGTCQHVEWQESCHLLQCS